MPTNLSCIVSSPVVSVSIAVRSELIICLIQTFRASTDVTSSYSRGMSAFRLEGVVDSEVPFWLLFNSASHGLKLSFSNRWASTSFFSGLSLACAFLS